MCNLWTDMDWCLVHFVYNCSQVNAIGRTPLMLSQNWFGKCLGWCQVTSHYTWTNVDQDFWCHIVSLDYNALKQETLFNSFISQNYTRCRHILANYVVLVMNKYKTTWWLSHLYNTNTWKDGLHFQTGTIWHYSKWPLGTSSIHSPKWANGQYVHLVATMIPSALPLSPITPLTDTKWDKVLRPKYQEPHLLTWINLIPAGISNYIHYKVWHEITYPFPNFNGATIEVWEWISNFIPQFYRACDYLSMLVLKLNHVSKRGPSCPPEW